MELVGKTHATHLSVKDSMIHPLYNQSTFCSHQASHHIHVNVIDNTLRTCKILETQSLGNFFFSFFKDLVIKYWER